jgi:predicted permease
LLSIEIAVTFVLIVGAALLAQTLWNLTVLDKGFDQDRLLTFRVAPGLPRDLDRSDRNAAPAYWAGFFTDLSTRLGAIRGVNSAGAISLPPLAGTASGVVNVSIDGRPVSQAENRTAVAFVTPGYLRTMRTPLLRGREFDERDRLGSDLAAIVNESFQRQYAPGRDILGARITSQSGPEVFTIVGIARNVPDWSLRQEPEPLLLAPLAQMPGVHISWGALTFVMRTADANPRSLAPEVATMAERVAVGMRPERDSAVVFGLFAGAALLIAAIGVYGVAAYAMAQRTREIGIRIALGAGKRDVSRVVVAQALWPTVIGVAIGAGVGAAATGLVAPMVYGVRPLDAATFTGTAVLLIGVAVTATWMPARRAARVDPVTALRAE